jgi:hypothetical protein
MIHVVVGQSCECTLKVNEYTSSMDKFCFKDYDTCSHFAIVWATKFTRVDFI